MGGHDMALEPLSDDDDESFAPIAYLADPTDEPGLVLEHDQSDAPAARAEQALAALDARSRRIIEHAGCASRMRRPCTNWADEFGFRRARSPDRGSSDEENACA